jgi:hypothetical protein
MLKKVDLLFVVAATPQPQTTQSAFSDSAPGTASFSQTKRNDKEL